MLKVTVNGKEIDVPTGVTVFQACEIAGVEIPHFCYHPKLSVAGNCRMCLVEIEKSPKPVASCAMPAGDGMVIHTHTPMVKAAREGVLELLLINHPLDCPICDQGGECDLQDLTMGYGRGASRYEFEKRAVREKHMGPLIQTVMTRCIHCTRCVRFATEIAGSHDVGTIGRGEHTEIVSYLEGAVKSELSGNLIDICPVGALTSKPYAFHGRSWELKKTDSIDVMDAVGSNIRLDSRGREVMRVLPRPHPHINEEWISDKIRFSYDGLKIQRLDRPYFRQDGSLVACTWDEALGRIKDKMTPRVAALAGDLVDVESTYLLAKLLKKMGTQHMDCRPCGVETPTKPGQYTFNTGIAEIENVDALLLIGTNPRFEAPTLNARIRKAHIATLMPIALIGEAIDAHYAYTHLGGDLSALEELNKMQGSFAKILKKAKKPAVIVGESVFAHPQAAVLLNELVKTYSLVREDHNGFNILHHAAGRVGAMDVGFLPASQGMNTRSILNACQRKTIDVLFLHGRDDISRQDIGPDVFVIYIGHHGDQGAEMADVVLPGAAYSEKTALYVNTEGRCQRAYAAISPPGDAREDFQIIRMLYEVLGYPCRVQNQGDIWKELSELSPHFARIGAFVPRLWSPLTCALDASHQKMPLQVMIQNFYMSNVITKNSPTMAACVRDIALSENIEVKTHV